MVREKRAAPRLPPLPPAAPATPEEAAARKLAREQKDARVRGVASIADMREAIKQAARSLPAMAEVPRVKRLDAAGFRARARQGLPFIMTGVVER